MNYEDVFYMVWQVLGTLTREVESGRYKAMVVDGGGSGYLRTVCDYVQLNPVREQDLKRRAKSAPEKLAMAARLRRETTLSMPTGFGPLSLPP